MPKLTLKLDEASCGSVQLDGVDVPGVTAISYTAVAGDLAKLQLTIFAEIDLEAEIRFDQLMIEKKRIFDEENRAETAPPPKDTDNRR